MGQTVAILGGGIGGLSAAHELAERGFEVRVFESKPIFGGKARSIPVPNSAVDGRKLLPASTDSGFFPGSTVMCTTPCRASRFATTRGACSTTSSRPRGRRWRGQAPPTCSCSRFPRDRHDWKTAIRGPHDEAAVVLDPRHPPVLQERETGP